MKRLFRAHKEDDFDAHLTECTEKKKCLYFLYGRDDAERRKEEVGKLIASKHSPHRRLLDLAEMDGDDVKDPERHLI